MNKKVVDKKHFVFAKCSGGSGEVRKGPGEINLFQLKGKKQLWNCVFLIKASTYMYMYIYVD